MKPSDGLANSESASCHEGVRSNALGMYLRDNEDISNDVDMCFAKFKSEKPWLWNALSSQSIEVDEALLAWASGRLESYAPEFVEAKMV